LLIFSFKELLFSINLLEIVPLLLGIDRKFGLNQPRETSPQLIKLLEGQLQSSPPTQSNLELQIEWLDFGFWIFLSNFADLQLPISTTTTTTTTALVNWNSNKLSMCQLAGRASVEGHLLQHSNYLARSLVVE